MSRPRDRDAATRRSALPSMSVPRTKFARLLLLAGAILSAIAAVAALALYGTSEFILRRTHPVTPEMIRAGGPPDIAEGRRLAKLYGCTSCHGDDYRGLRYNDDPDLVRNHAPNLTLIAARTPDSGLAQAIRQGVSAQDGRALWGMPSATFRTITDAELAAVLAHLRSMPVGGSSMKGGSPTLRARIALLRGVFSNDDNAQRSAPALIAAAKVRPPLDLGPKYAAGRHIAATVCSECHGSDLAGNAVEGGTDLMIAAAYDLEDFRRLMRTGVPPGGRDLGLMAETAREDLTVFTDGEIEALHAYLVERSRAH
jgi:mono/diheme cytochrome c family protein